LLRSNAQFSQAWVELNYLPCVKKKKKKKPKITILEKKNFEVTTTTKRWKIGPCMYGRRTSGDDALHAQQLVDEARD
jgi:hypothetical protein